MAGEHILLVDNSVAVQELGRTTLENQGYRVTVASNGVAALTHPDIASIDLIVIDSALRDMSGLDTARAIRGDADLVSKPVLLLVPEEQASDRQSQDLFGANAYVLKPFEPNILVRKVQVLLEERHIEERGHDYLRQSAEQMMKQIADTTIQQAIEQRTQIIIERAIQNVVTQVDQRARREVDTRVTQLTGDKEQELVKLTVHEVARSMVEKLAERKVTEAMENILRDETEKAVRRMADSMLPGLARERIREQTEHVLPREVARAVQREAENLVPEASQKVVQVIEAGAAKLIPKMARERISELAERQIEDAIQQQLPRHVQLMVAQELEVQLRTKIAPLVAEAAREINRRTRMWMWVFIGIFLVTWVVLITTRYIGGGIAGTAAGVARIEKTPSPSPTGASPLDLLKKLPKPAASGR